MNLECDNSEESAIDNDSAIVLQESESFETDIFFRMARKMYSDCSMQCESLFDIAMDKTNGFRTISPEIIIDDSRIIKVLRYCMLPVISQMKLGQLG